MIDVCMVDITCRSVCINNVFTSLEKLSFYINGYSNDLVIEDQSRNVESHYSLTNNFDSCAHKPQPHSTTLSMMRLFHDRELMSPSSSTCSHMEKSTT